MSIGHVKRALLEKFQREIAAELQDRASNETPLVVSEKSISIWDARVKMTDMVMRVRYKRERFVIEKHGVPLALVIPIDSIPTLAAAPEPASPMSKLKVFATGT